MEESTLEGLFAAAKLDDFLVDFKELTGAEDLDDLLESSEEVSHGVGHSWTRP